ncbi:MAG: hypothetical protein AAFP19_22090, partial [Bacteroidota bacterium]
SNFIRLSPRIGYAVIPNLIASINTNLSRSTFTFDFGLNNEEEKTTANTIGAGPAIRYYLNFGPELALIGEAGALFTRSTVRRDSGDREGFNSNFLTGSVGLAYFLNPYVSLEMLLSYQRQNNNVNTGGSTFEDSANMLLMNIGIQVVLPAKNIGED